MSQVWKDSLFLDPQEARINSISLLRHNLRPKGETKYGKISLDYGHTAGSYRRAQEPYSKNNIAFNAEGISRIGRMRLSGDFSFNKSFEDSLANALRSDIDLLSPNYYYAGKANDYQRQNYIANMTLSYDVIPDRLLPFLNVNYHYHWTTGSSDPRPEVKTISIKFNPGVGYSVNKNTAVSLMAILGRSSEQTGISFKNINYRESLAFPERIDYFNFGYGYSNIKDTTRLRKYTSYAGGELTLKSKFGKWELLSYLRLTHSATEHTHTTLSRKVYSSFADFTLNNYSGRLIFTRKGISSDHQFDLETNFRDGYDGNSKFSADLSKVNYQVSQGTIGFFYSIIFDKAKDVQKEVGIGLGYIAESREDKAQSTLLSNRQLTLTGLYRAYFPMGQHGLMKATISPFYSAPLETTLSTNVNSIVNFTRNVVFTDYYYFNSNLAGTTVGLSWSGNNLLKTNILEFSADLQYTHKLNDPPVIYSPGFMPDKYRMHANIGVKLFF